MQKLEARSVCFAFDLGLFARGAASLKSEWAKIKDGSEHCLFIHKVLALKSGLSGIGKSYGLATHKKYVF